ncbi:MAG: hypothetical protein AAB923_01970, partial [Patescibacteria group bacterium]
MMRLALFALLLLGAAPHGADAAILPPQNYVTEIASSPQHPKPGDTVNLTASVIGNPGSFVFLWTANDGDLAQGVGLTKTSVRAGAVGTAIRVAVTIVDSQGNIQGGQEFLIRPADVDLIWEAKTYVPPLYTGRPLPNQGSRISIQAVPRLIDRGAPIAPERLSYLWSVDGKPVGANAYGKTFITVTPPYFSRPFTVSVKAQTLDGLFAGESSVTIRPVKPLSVVYENRPLSGIAFNAAADFGAALAVDEVTYRAYPVYVE